MSWVRGQQKGEGKTDNPTTGGRGGGKDSTATGRRGNRLGGQTIKQEGGRQFSRQGSRRGRQAHRRKGVRTDNPTTGGSEERGDGRHNRRGRPRQPSRRDGGQAIKQDEGAEDRTWKGFGRFFALCHRLVAECEIGNSHLRASSAEEVQLASWCNG